MKSAWWQGDYGVTQPYGCTDFAEEGFNPNHRECAYFHDGLDLALPCGTVLFSPVGATVVQVGIYGGGPFALKLRSGEWDYWLLHLQANYVGVGDQVQAGMPIGESDNYGFSTGCHLHFQVTPAGGGYRDSVDPGPFLGGAPPLAASSRSEESSLRREELPLQSVIRTFEHETSRVYVTGLNTWLDDVFLDACGVDAPEPAKLAVIWTDYQGNELAVQQLELAGTESKAVKAPENNVVRLVVEASAVPWSGTLKFQLRGK